VTLTGDNLGDAAAVVTAQYTPKAAEGSGNAAAVFAALDCRVTVPHTELKCTAAPGFGKELVWRVSISGVENRVESPLSYAPPEVHSVATDPLGLDTRGGGVVVVEGDNFGTAGAPLDAVYGADEEMARFRAVCQHWNPSLADKLLVPNPNNASDLIPLATGAATSHTRLVCEAAPGIGHGHRWIVMVGGEASERSAAGQSTS